MKLSLQENEGIIIQRDNVYCVTNKDFFDNPGTLVLTNLNLYYVHDKGLLGFTSETFQYALNQINVVNGKGQVMLGDDNGQPILQVFMENQRVAFRFEGSVFKSKLKKEIEDWITQINQVIGTIPLEPSKSGTGTVKGIYPSQKNTPDNVNTLKSKANLTARPDEIITCKCIGCRAPIEGKRGQEVRCKYCGTTQTL